ncbi:hypothetical protein GCM10027521_64160 [Amycolatopsis cihanbeyliensis]
MRQQSCLQVTGRTDTDLEQEAVAVAQVTSHLTVGRPLAGPGRGARSHTTIKARLT